MNSQFIYNVLIYSYFFKYIKSCTGICLFLLSFILYNNHEGLSESCGGLAENYPGPIVGCVSARGYENMAEIC